MIRRNRHSRLLIAAAALAFAVVTGCGSPPPPPPPTIVRGSIGTEPTVNPDGRNRPSPIVVRVLELKATAAFQSGDFFQLWDHPKDALGEDLVFSDEYGLKPGEQRSFERRPPPESKYIAVIAAYRDYPHSEWRSVIPIAPNKTQTVAIRLEERKVVLQMK